ncbi:hypothetical protein ACWD6U_42215, partial [Streptomyces sp. NPDC005149]
MEPTAPTTAGFPTLCRPFLSAGAALGAPPPGRGQPGRRRTAARRAFDERLAMTLAVALYSRDKVRAGGTLL